MKKALSVALSTLLLSGCGDMPSINPFEEEPQIATQTTAGNLLQSVPLAQQKIVVALYNFEDQTGQYKPNAEMTDYSRAVTQGGLAILSKALIDTGNHSWFTVVERGGLKNLMQERQIVRAMREQYTTPDGQRLDDIGPLLYAGMLLEGGIIAYDTNTMTGGLGAKWLGVGGSTEYRRDMVTVYLRATSIQSGEVLLSVNTSKTIYSTLLQGGAFRYVSLNRLLEVESGIGVNEPPQLAVRQAIEMAVYSMVMEGAIQGLWNFADAAEGEKALADYQLIRDGATTIENVLAQQQKQETSSLLGFLSDDGSEQSKERSAQDAAALRQQEMLLEEAARLPVVRSAPIEQPEMGAQPLLPQTVMTRQSIQPETVAPPPVPANAAVPQSVSDPRINGNANRKMLTKEELYCEGAECDMPANAPRSPTAESPTIRERATELFNDVF